MSAPTRLPIDDVKERVIETARAGRAMVLTAPTGSGKSTRVPGFLEQAAGGSVLVLEPRRVACRALASFLAEDRGGLGREVGYRVRFEDRSSDETKLLFVTPGVALRLLRAERLPFAAVLVDEFHERSWQMDLAVTLLRIRRARGERFGLAVASATLAARALAEEMDAALIEASGRTFPVDVAYRDTPGSPTTRDVEERVRDEVRAALARDDGGDVLVFLPGKGEIERCRRELEDARAAPSARVLAVHGGVPPSRLAAAFRGDGGRRVYLATNVAETSLTIPGVRTVLDVGLVRQRIHRAGRSVLALTSASQASLDQRAGRAGRTAPGRCIRLFSERHRPEAHTPPELARVELDDLLLEAAAAGLPAGELADAPWPSPPPPFALEEARARLFEQGALDERGALTERGRRLAALPLSASDAAVLLDPPAAIAAHVADVAALLDLDRDLLLPLGAVSARERDDGALARAELLGDARHEVDAALRMLRAGRVARHGLHGGALDGARKRARVFRDLLKVHPKDPTRDEGGSVDWEAVAEHLLRRVPQAGFVRRPRADKKPARKPRGRPSLFEPWANGEVEVELVPWRPPGDDAEPVEARAGVVLQHTWLEGGKRQAATGRGWMLLPCPPRVLAHAGLGQERTVEPSVRVRADRVDITARVERVLADVVLSSEERRLDGDALRRALARLVVERRWLKGGREPVLDDLHLWRLVARWPTGDLEVPRQDEVSMPPDEDEWLRAQLETLGVEEPVDAGLVERDDLRPDLERETGLPAWELERLRADFPRTWEYEGGTWVCGVDPVARRVTLEPADNVAKKHKTPPATKVPRFRGFRVRHRQASRVVDLR